TGLRDAEPQTVAPAIADRGALDEAIDEAVGPRFLRLPSLEHRYEGLELDDRVEERVDAERWRPVLMHREEVRILDALRARPAAPGLEHGGQRLDAGGPVDHEHGSITHPQRA